MCFIEDRRRELVSSGRGGVIANRYADDCLLGSGWLRYDEGSLKVGGLKILV